MHVAKFVFNPFAENTYILYDDTKECIIIDPGCFNSEEENILLEFINANGLKPVLLFNTHCHIDHVLGNKFVCDQFDLSLMAHKGEVVVLQAAEMSSKIYSIPYTTSPEISLFAEEGTPVLFGNTSLDVLFTPGHSPASLSLYHADSGQLIAGDVLFYGSIGRTDLPGGDFDTLIHSIKNKYFDLPDNTRVFSGHGEETTIGFEKKHNPFLI